MDLPLADSSGQVGDVAGCTFLCYRLVGDGMGGVSDTVDRARMFLCAQACKKKKKPNQRGE